MIRLYCFLTIAACTSLAAEPPRSVLDLSYNTDEIGPSDVASNSLDLYLPARPDDGAGLRPLVVWVQAMTCRTCSMRRSRLGLPSPLGAM